MADEIDVQIADLKSKIASLSGEAPDPIDSQITELQSRIRELEKLPDIVTVHPSYLDAAKDFGRSIVKGVGNIAKLSDLISPTEIIKNAIAPGSGTGSLAAKGLDDFVGDYDPSLKGDVLNYTRAVGESLPFPGGPVSNALVGIGAQGARDLNLGPVGEFVGGVVGGTLPGGTKAIVNALRPSVAAKRSVGRLVNAITEATGPNLEEGISNTKRVGEVADTLKAMREEVRVPASEKYEQIKNAPDVMLNKTLWTAGKWADEQGASLPPKIKSIRDSLERQATSVDVLAPEGVIPKGTVLGPRGETLTGELAPSMKPSEALALRRELGKMAKSKDGPTKLMGRELSKALDEDLGAKFTPEEIDVFKSANKEWANLINTFDRGLVGELTKQDANLTRIPKNFVVNAEEAEKIISLTANKPELQTKIKSIVLSDLLTASQPAAWKNKLNRHADAYNKYFGKDGYEKLSNLLSENSDLMRNRTLLEKVSLPGKIAVVGSIASAIGIPWQAAVLAESVIAGRSSAVKSMLNETTRESLWGLSRGKPGVKSALEVAAKESLSSDLTNTSKLPILRSLGLGVDDYGVNEGTGGNSDNGTIGGSNPNLIAEELDSSSSQNANSNSTHTPNLTPISYDTQGENMPVSDKLLDSVRIQETGGIKNPNEAISKAGAKGAYQFMMPTWKAISKKYGLPEDGWKDERVSRKGAEYLLNDLYDKYKDIDLALFAYNAGEPRVDKAIKAAGSKNPKKVAKFLAPETQAYAPEILARIGRLSSVV